MNFFGITLKDFEVKIKLAVGQVEVGRKSEKKQQNALIVNKMKVFERNGR